MISTRLHCASLSLAAILITSFAFGDVPPEIAANADQWPLPNANYSSTRAAIGSGVSSENLGALAPRWYAPISTEPNGFTGAIASNPLILDDVVYFQDNRTNLYALELETGKSVWEQPVDLYNGGPNGPAVAYGKIFASKGYDEVAAVDLQSGEEVWSTKLPRTSTEGIDIQPIVYDGLVYVSTIPGNSNGFYSGNATGVIYALDQSTGETRWSFNTVDSDDIWGVPTVNSGGGAWYPGSIDVERGVTYWGIGNPAPWPGTAVFPNGSSRPGDNLYTNSVVALDHATGELKWYNQVRPHDLFDLDFQISPILTTATIAGQERDLVIGAGKTGTVVAFDADTGETLWDVPVGIHQNDDLTDVPPGQVVEVFPGALGGVMTPMAYADGVVFAPVNNLGSRFNPSSHVGTSPGPPERRGELVALGVESGEVLWNAHFPDQLYGAATVVNDLVFTSTYGGKIYALDRLTGEELWSYQAPGGINGWPAVAGDKIVFPVGFPSGGRPGLMALGVVNGPTDLVHVAPSTAFAARDVNGDGNGNRSFDVSQLEQALVGDVDYPGGSRDGVQRLILKFTLPQVELELASAKLRVFLDGVEGTLSAGLSLFHDPTDEDFGLAVADYQAESYQDAQLTLTQPADASARYLEVDVTTLVAADYASGIAIPSSAFRLQVTDAVFDGDGESRGYLLAAGGSDRGPELVLSFVPEPSSLLLASSLLLWAAIRMMRRRRGGV